MKRPRGLLFDYGGTLVEEVGFDMPAAVDWLLTHAVSAPTAVDLERIRERTERVTTQVTNRRDEFHIETPWPALTRLIHDACGTRFNQPVEELERGFWDAGVETRAMPGAREALGVFHEQIIKTVSHADQELRIVSMQNVNSSA
jgi:putative hydrolase of the HAD superfamily